MNSGHFQRQLIIRLIRLYFIYHVRPVWLVLSSAFALISGIKTFNPLFLCTIEGFTLVGFKPCHFHAYGLVWQCNFRHRLLDDGSVIEFAHQARWLLLLLV